MPTRLRALAGAALLLLAGCQSYHPYGYGYNGAYTIPQGTYIPPGAQGPLTPQAQLQPSPATTYTEPTTSKSANSTTRQLPDALLNDSPVPTPHDAAAPPRSNLTDPNADEIDKSGLNPTGAELDPQPSNPPNYDKLLDESDHLRDQLGPESISREPGKLDQMSAEEVGTGASLAEGERIPFDYDENEHSFLQGIVDFDEQEGVWRIQYADDIYADVYSGRLTLAADDRLDSLLVKDVVRLRGRVDPGQRDAKGKPCYVLDTRKDAAQRLRPRRQ